MKKLTLIVCALAMTMAMNAIVTQRPNQKLVEKTSTPTFRDVTMTLGDFAENALQQKNALDTFLYMPYYVPGAFQVGKPDDGLGYDYYTQGLVAPYADSVTFYRGYTKVYGHDLGATSWYLGGEEVAANATQFTMSVGAFDEFELPVMKTQSISFNDTTVAFEDYQTADQWVEFMKAYGDRYNNKLCISDAYLSVFTPCAMYTDTFKNQYGEDYTRFRAGQYGYYAYGCDLINPYISTEEEIHYMDTLITLIPNEGAMYIDHITLAIWTMRDDDNPFPAEGDHARLSIYPLTATGIDWANPIAQGRAGIDDYTPYSSSYNWLGLLNFKFTEEDPITGAITQVPAMVNGDFVLVLDEYNDATADFGIFSDAYATNGNTYFAFSADGKLNIKQMWSINRNLLYSLNAIMPAFVGPKEINFELEGGEQEFKIKTNIWDEDMEIDAPDWIDVEMVTDYTTEEYQGQTYYEHKYINTLTVTVDETASGRSGDIEINALGLPVTIKVNQGGAQGVNTIKAVNDNKMYNVLGIEVDEDYKGVVIRNGQKFIR